MNEEESKAYYIQHKKEYPRQYSQYKGNHLFAKSDSTFDMYNTYGIDLDFTIGDTAKAYLHNRTGNGDLIVELVDLLQDRDRKGILSDEEIIDVTITEDLREKNDSTDIQQ